MGGFYRLLIWSNRISQLDFMEMDNLPNDKTIQNTHGGVEMRKWVISNRIGSTHKSCNQIFLMIVMFCKYLKSCDEFWEASTGWNNDNLCGELWARKEVTRCGIQINLLLNLPRINLLFLKLKMPSWN